ncbi:MAG TPA: response regulator [Candidatus Angelobacter sp.]|nr:response regulator [Candidatus Angelobacter sp.]
MNQKKILLVDDEPNIRILLGSILKQAGYTVDVAEDGFAALHSIQQAMPDLVITDLRMPNMNGFELLSVIRTRFPELPAIAISGEFVNVHEGPLADAFFQKGSYEVPKFLGTIADLLSGLRRNAHKLQVGSIWTPVKDEPIMLTCTECLKTFPVDQSYGFGQSKHIDCIFCNTRLEIQLVAIGIAKQASK